MDENLTAFCAMTTRAAYDRHGFTSRRKFAQAVGCAPSVAKKIMTGVPFSTKFARDAARILGESITTLRGDLPCPRFEEHVYSKVVDLVGRALSGALVPQGTRAEATDLSEWLSDWGVGPKDAQAVLNAMRAMHLARTGGDGVSRLTPNYVSEVLGQIDEYKFHFAGVVNRLETYLDKGHYVRVRLEIESLTSKVASLAESEGSLDPTVAWAAIGNLLVRLSDRSSYGRPYHENRLKLCQLVLAAAAERHPPSVIDTALRNMMDQTFLLSGQLLEADRIETSYPADESPHRGDRSTLEKRLKGSASVAFKLIGQVEDVARVFLPFQADEP